MLNFIFFSFGFVTGSQVDPAVCNYDSDRDNFPGGKFPDDFRWALATASYQIEGRWNADGKGLGMWDVFAHEKNPCKVLNCMNGDIACDSYNQIDRDIENIKSLGVKVKTRLFFGTVLLRGFN